MPLSYTYDPTTGVIMGRMTGKVTVEEFRAVFKEIFASKVIPPNAHFLWNLRDLDVTSFDYAFTSDLVHFRKTIRERRGNARVAVVATDKVRYGIARMYESIADNSDTQSHLMRIFATEDEAVAWLTR